MAKSDSLIERLGKRNERANTLVSLRREIDAASREKNPGRRMKKIARILTALGISTVAAAVIIASL